MGPCSERHRRNSSSIMKTCPMFFVILAFAVIVDHVVDAHPASDVKASADEHKLDQSESGKGEKNDVSHITLLTEVPPTNSTGSATDRMETKGKDSLNVPFEILQPEIIIFQTNSQESDKNSTLRNANGAHDKPSQNACSKPEEMIIFELSPSPFIPVTFPFVSMPRQCGHIGGPMNMQDNNQNQSKESKRHHGHRHRDGRGHGHGHGHGLNTTRCNTQYAHQGENSPQDNEKVSPDFNQLDTNPEIQPSAKHEAKVDAGEQTGEKPARKSDSKEEIKKP